jgi:predicted acetyltransferase
MLRASFELATTADDRGAPGRRYRRHGVGERAAGWLFDRFAGIWEVRRTSANTQATAFWRRIIGRRGRFEDLVVDDERWHGPVQRFDSRTSATSR